MKPALFLALSLLASVACRPREFNSQSETNSRDLREAKDNFFRDDKIYLVNIEDWKDVDALKFKIVDKMNSQDSRFSIAPLRNPNEPTACPKIDKSDRIFQTRAFNISTSGDSSKGNPKHNYRVRFLDKDERFLGIRRFNIKGLFTEPSHIREALSYQILREMNVAAPRHTYARVCVNGNYLGLFEVLEQLDEPFLKDSFGDEEGNLFKCNWRPDDIGPANLVYRPGPRGEDDPGAYYRLPDMALRSYSLKMRSEEDDDAHDPFKYQDLIRFIKVLNGVELPGNDDSKFDTPEYARQMLKIFDVYPFLRTQATNMLIGGWDSYYVTTKNYFLYNVGRKKNIDKHPYFHFLPWDYDTTLGTRYDPFTDWATTDIMDFEKSAQQALKIYPGLGSRVQLPLITNLLKNREFKKYYVQTLDYLLKRYMSESWFAARTNQIFPMLAKSIQLESPSPECLGGPTAPCAPTGRMFSWNEISNHVLAGRAIEKPLPYAPEAIFRSEAISSFVKRRVESARRQMQQIVDTNPGILSGKYEF